MGDWVGSETKDFLIGAEVLQVLHRDPEDTLVNFIRETADMLECVERDGFKVTQVDMVTGDPLMIKRDLRGFRVTAEYRPDAGL